MDDDKIRFFDSRLYTPSEICQQIGRRVRLLRQARGLRQRELAAAAGVRTPTIGRLEHTGVVGFDVLVRVAFALGAEDDLNALFRVAEPRSLDDILRRPRERKRVRPR